jgi:hypothetical protein
LEAGLKLDINQLARHGVIRPGAATGPVGIRWTSSGYWGEITNGIIVADMSGHGEGWFHVQIGQLRQHIRIVARPRHFGGQQWFFLCPYLNQRCMVLWKPPGAHSFACRQQWGRQVAYASQFCDRINRAHRGKARINTRLCEMGGFDPDEWDFAPKPKWMRWATYRRAEALFYLYQAILDGGLADAAAKFQQRRWLK